MYPFKDGQLGFPKGIEQPILFINMEDYLHGAGEKGKTILERFTKETESNRPAFILKYVIQF